MARRLFDDDDLVFMVSSFTHRAAGSSITGYCMDDDGCVWKLILRKVHWPWIVSLTDLMVETWKGMNVVAELGIRTADLFMST